MAERLGEGASGIVYRAVHVGLEKAFAIKLLKIAGPPAPSALERFRKEAVVLGRLRHPNLVAVTDFGIDGSEGGRPYIVTELLEGMPLSDVCRVQGPLSLAQALPLLEQIAIAIDAAHDAGVLHRALKPGNVFVCAMDPPRVKILSFGLAELFLHVGKPSRAWNIYSFGVLAYEILGGKPPVRGSLEEALAGNLGSELPPPPVPPQVRRALLDTLQQDQSFRFDTAVKVIHEFVDAAIAAERMCEQWTIEISRPYRGTDQLGNRGPSNRSKSTDAILVELKKQYSHALNGAVVDSTGGTAVLIYYVDESQSFLLVQRGPDWRFLIYQLAIGREKLEKEVERFCNVWGGPDTDLVALKERGRHLYDLLIRPAEPVLGKADLWVISPDGPLHSLPFAVLFSGIDYLANSKLIYIAASTRKEQKMYLRKLDGYRYNRTARRAVLTHRKIEDFLRPYYIQITGGRFRLQHPVPQQITRERGPAQGHPDPLLLDSFVRGKLNGAEHTTVGDHLVGCPECWMEIGRMAIAMNGRTERHARVYERKFTSALGELISPPRSRSRLTPQTLRECPPSLLIKAGHLVGEKYRLEERLGEGAIGVVYRAFHAGLEKAVAVKLLKTAGAPAPDTLERFRREAVALGRLRHPNIVAVTDFGIDRKAGGLPYIVTELLEGWSLSDICRDQPPLQLMDAFFLLSQIAAAVDSAHDAGVLHRDLKPGNIFVCSDNPDSPSVKVLDFGLAKLSAGPNDSGRDTLLDGAENPSGLTTTGLLLGTPLYLAPEVIRLGQASRSSDIYSFGVLAYEILGGRPPFQGTLEEVLAYHLEADPPPLPLPPEIWRPLRETLQKDPALRPGTTGEVVRRLRIGLLNAEQARACWASAKRYDTPRLHFSLRRFASKIRTFLARGTMLLFYDVGWSQSFLVVVEAAPGEGSFFYTLAIERDEIKREVEAFRDVWSGPSTDLSALKERGRRLYDLLVRPAEPVLAKADRWLISLDGPLETLPFAALFSGSRYLADIKPIYIDHRLTDLRQGKR